MDDSRNGPALPAARRLSRRRVLAGSRVSAQQASPTAAASPTGPVSLAFDKNNYTVQTKTVSTASGNKTVAYHSIQGHHLRR